VAFGLKRTFDVLFSVIIVIQEVVRSKGDQSIAVILGIRILAESAIISLQTAIV
jgi:hypothetical protein